MTAGTEEGERKTRSLRKYEGEATALAADAETPKLDLIAPFGPVIARSEVSPTLVESINRFADRHLRPGEGAELLLPGELVNAGGEGSLLRQTESLIARYVRRVEAGAAPKIQFDAFWIVSQYAGTPSPVHFHTGDISGVMYLKVPMLERGEQEERKTYISGRQAGYVNFLIGGKQRFSRSLISFKPRVGDYYIFPGWLLHGAEPFRGSGERRSLAFNAFVDS